MKQSNLPTSNFPLSKALLKSIKVLVFVLLLSVSFNSQTQEKYAITEKDYSNTDVEMADMMRQNGKIYVVVGVIMIIFVGITFYLVRLDKRVKAMEKELRSKEQ